MAILERPTASTIPRLLVTVPLEGNPSILVDARSFEDELALRGWLRHSGHLDWLAAVLSQLLDDLDDQDATEAA